jgi:hypothetical protein
MTELTPEQAETLNEKLFRQHEGRIESEQLQAVLLC